MGHRFIGIVRTARQAQCRLHVLRELFRQLLNYSRNYFLEPRRSGVPQSQRPIARGLRRTAGSREGIRAPGAAVAWPARFTPSGRGFYVYHSEPGLLCIPRVSRQNCPTGGLRITPDSFDYTVRKARSPGGRCRARIGVPSAGILCTARFSTIVWGARSKHRGNLQAASLRVRISGLWETSLDADPPHASFVFFYSPPSLRI